MDSFEYTQIVEPLKYSPKVQWKRECVLYPRGVNRQFKILEGFMRKSFYFLDHLAIINYLWFHILASLREVLRCRASEREQWQWRRRSVGSFPPLRSSIYYMVPSPAHPSKICKKEKKLPALLLLGTEGRSSLTFLLVLFVSVFPTEWSRLREGEISRHGV